MPNSYIPPEESPGQLSNERTWLEGAIFLGVAYGVELTIFVMCFHLLWQQTTRSNWKTNMPLLLYISSLFILGTLSVAAADRTTQIIFIDNRNFLDGPSVFGRVRFSIPIHNMGNAAFVIANWLADGLMVWRWLVIYRSCGVPTWAVMILPCSMLISSFVLGVFFLVQICAPASSPWATSAMNFTLPYFCVSLALNFIATIAIVCRLMYYRRRISSTLGTAYGVHYTTIAAIVVESAALYSTSSVLFLVPFILNHPIQNIFVQLLSPLQVIAPLMIIFRTAQGRAWSSTTPTQILSVDRLCSIKMNKTANLSTEGGSGNNFKAPTRVAISHTVFKEVAYENECCVCNAMRASSS